MSALLKPFTPWSLSEAVVADLTRNGLHVFEARIDPDGCEALLRDVLAVRRFDETLFLDEAEFETAAGAAPVRRRNLLDRFESKLKPLERAPHLVEALWSLLGPDFAVLDRELVCTLPPHALPDWVKRRLRGQSVDELGAFVRPEHRDLVYVCSGDFRQDLTAADRAADFLTLSVQLHPAAEDEAALSLLEGSHRMGGQPAPHQLKRTGLDAWRYRAGDLGEVYVTERMLAGETGAAVLWHACALHAAHGEALEHPAFSLRCRIGRGSSQTCGLDAVNATLAGPVSLAANA
jgi:hypothetical protein